MPSARLGSLLSRFFPGGQEELRGSESDIGRDGSGTRGHRSSGRPEASETGRSGEVAWADELPSAAVSPAGLASCRRDRAPGHRLPVTTKAAVACMVRTDA